MYPLHTVVERNNPTALDLKKHQLFIDTTRNSAFYKSLANWKPSEFAYNDITEYINLIKTDFPISKVLIKNFPKYWITLRKLNGSFILYDRCDGIDRRFEITDSTFISYGPLESDADLLYKLVSANKDKIVIETRTIKERESSQKAILTITSTATKDIYILDYFGEKRFVAPLDKIKNFELLVNNCPDMKVLEYNRFDK